MALRARNPSPSGLATLNPPEHVPRTSTMAQTGVRGPGGLPACHGADREHEERLAAGRGKNAEGPKKHI